MTGTPSHFGPAPSPVVASHMAPAIADRTWSTASTDRRARCHLFLLASGGAVVAAADHADLDIPAPAMLWLPPATPASLRLPAGASGYTAAILADFVQRAVGDAGLTTPLRPLLGQTVLAGGKQLPAALAGLSHAFAALVSESRAQQAGSNAMLKLHLGVLLLSLWRCAGPHATTRLHGAGASTLQRFRQLVEVYYRDGLLVDDFARRLGVTRAHLHDICLRATGRTPLALVHERLLQEARLRLRQTDLSVEQVGYGLGFRDPAYFNRFFKRLTGQPPGAFRQQADTTPPPAPSSFAAWP